MSARLIAGVSGGEIDTIADACGHDSLLSRKQDTRMQTMQPVLVA
jgi:hypothetical protein